MTANPVKRSFLSRAHRLSTAAFLGGLLYFLAIIHPTARQTTTVHESALLAGLVDEEIANDANFFHLKRQLHRRIASAVEPDSLTIDWVVEQFGQLSLETNVQRYETLLPTPLNVSGKVAYALLPAKRATSTECIAVIAPASSPTSVAFALFLASSVLDRNYWAKNLLFIVPQHSAVGTIAWLSSYHYGSHAYIRTSHVPAQAGRIEIAIGIHFDYVHQVRPNHLDIDFNQLNGQLPNLDLFNLAVRLARKQNLVPTIFGQPLRNDEASNRLRTTALGLLNQAVGLPLEVHSVCGQFRIHCLTLKPCFNSADRSMNGAELALARVAEGLLRSANNLQEVLHQSVFFYILPSAESYVSVGVYAPTIALFLLAPLIEALRIWFVHFKPEEEEEAHRRFSAFAKALPCMLVPCSGFLLLQQLPSLFWHELTGSSVKLLATAHLSFFLLPFVRQDDEDASQAFRCILLLLLSLYLACVGIFNAGLAIIYSLTILPVICVIRSRCSLFRSWLQFFLLMAIHPFLLSATMSQLVRTREAKSITVKNFISKLDKSVVDMLFNSYVFSDWSYTVTSVCFACWCAAMCLALPRIKANKCNQ